MPNVNHFAALLAAARAYMAGPSCDRWDALADAGYLWAGGDERRRARVPAWVGRLVASWTWRLIRREHGREQHLPSQTRREGDRRVCAACEAGRHDRCGRAVSASDTLCNCKTCWG